jgi:transposase-like protein
MQAVPKSPETEVVEKAKRRAFTAEYKRRILEEVDRASKPGEIGAILRREGLYSSVLSAWRRQREAGELAALTPRKRGPQAKVISPLERENEELKRRLARAEKRAERAEAIVDLQKKVSEILGIQLPEPPPEKS